MATAILEAAFLLTSSLLWFTFTRVCIVLNIFAISLHILSRGSHTSPCRFCLNCGFGVARPWVGCDPDWGESKVMKVAFFLALSLIAVTCHAQGAASAVFVSGNAQIVGTDGKTRAAVRGGQLFAGETVETVDGRVQLRFQDGAGMSLQPATRFRVDEYRFLEQNGKASDGDRGFFSLLRGGFRTLTGLLGKQQHEQYKVNTAVATIGIRGTDYSANLTDAGLSLSTFGGLVEVCSNAGCALVKPGETFIVADRESKPQRKGPASEGMSVMPDLPPPKPGELLPAVTPPVQAPTPVPTQGPAPVQTQMPTQIPTQIPPTGSPMQGPGYPPQAGPSR